jgi:thioredoxin reductase (NADPH)
MFDVCIIGSGPAGLTAALYMLQSGFKTALITGSEIGGTLQKIKCITNYPGFDKISGTDLADKMLNQIYQYQDDLTIIMDDATGLVYNQNKIWEISCLYSEKICSKSIINAIGLIPRKLGLANEDKFITKGISFCALCDGPFFKDKHVGVIGGGNSAVEYATTLAGYCKQVDIFYRKNQLKANATFLKTLNQFDNINIFFGTNVIELIGENKLTKITYKHNNGEIKTIDMDCLFYAIGHEKPIILVENEFDNNQVGCFHGYFEAGDYSEQIHQIITACGSGCNAAVACMEFLKLYSEG